MENEKRKIRLPIVVEGKYDKIKIDSIFDATVILTGGFSVFNNKERQLLIRRLGERGIIVLTDSDGGGKQIRAFLQGLLPKDKIFNVYIPKIEGKERRKDHKSKEGLLGVEGVDKAVLLKAFAPFIEKEIDEETDFANDDSKEKAADNLLKKDGESAQGEMAQGRGKSAHGILQKREEKRKITKLDFYCDKLSGTENASANRAAVARLAELPDDMTANALLEALNLLYDFKGYKELIAKAITEK